MTDLAHFGSPKRKRDLTDTLGRAASPLRMKMDLDHSGDGSECHISNEFQDLRIQAPESMAERLSNVRGLHQMASSVPSSGMAQPAPPVPADDVIDAASPSSATRTPKPNLQSQRGVTHQHLAPPRTPPLHPVSLSPYDTPRTISPLPSLNDLSGSAALYQPPPSPSPTTSSEQQQQHVSLATPPPSSPPPKRNRSPSPTASLSSDLVWTAEEITGHNPNDPNDDGYGINGIGFRPTSAVAQQRALRRRQQVAEWKTREARDARNRRAERRRDGFGRTLDREGGRHVRFVEG